MLRLSGKLSAKHSSSRFETPTTRVRLGASCVYVGTRVKSIVVCRGGMASPLFLWVLRTGPRANFPCFCQSHGCYMFCGMLLDVCSELLAHRQARCVCWIRVGYCFLKERSVLRSYIRQQHAATRQGVLSTSRCSFVSPSVPPVRSDVHPTRPSSSTWPKKTKHPLDSYGS